jgi:DNA-binding XRE family transcriptional regulator
MMSLTLVPNVSLFPTIQSESLTIVDPAKVPVTPATAPSNVTVCDFYRVDDFPMPDGFVDIDSAVEEQERDPGIRAGIARARMRLAEQLPFEQNSLAYLRMRSGLSQKQLAEKIGTSQPHIARIESGRDNVLLRTANLLAKALDSTLDEINRALGY